MTTAWQELSRPQQCVLCAASSGDGSGLPDILNSWDPWWQPDDVASYSTELTAAIVALVSRGLVVVYDGMLAGDPVMSIEAIGRATANPGNWFYGDDGLEQVVWVATTDAGDRVGSEAPSADVLQYFDMRHSLRERREVPRSQASFSIRHAPRPRTTTR